VKPRLSVVIPALDEREHLPATLRSLQGEGDAVETIVADGGSTDGTWQMRHEFPHVRFVRSARGRGPQLDAGAALATAPLLLFLHADTRPPAGFVTLIEQALSRPQVVAGSFCLSFDPQSPLLRLYARCSRWSHPLFTYGDQGLFTRRSVFDAVGGYAGAPFMEDVEILRRLRRLGRVVKVPVPVMTSARRFVAGGILRQQVRNVLLVAAYHAGISPRRLARWYPVRPISISSRPPRTASRSGEPRRSPTPIARRG
jgi:rSAM/selenodomain-associated transferase 2